MTLPRPQARFVATSRTTLRRRTGIVVEASRVSPQPAALTVAPASGEEAAIAIVRTPVTGRSRNSSAAS